MTAPALAPRLLRAAVFTAVCVVLSALGHALAACAGIALWTLLTGFLGVFGITVLFTGRERSLGFVVGALAGGQLGLHTLFSLGQRPLALSPEADDALVRMAAKLICGAGTGAISAADAARIVRDAGLDPATAHAHLGHATATAPAGGLLPGLPMLLGHLLAALAAGWLLRRGDLALVRLVQLSEQGATELAECTLVRALRVAFRLVRSLLAGLSAAPHARARRPARTAFDSSPPPVAEALRDTVIRRGPPAADCVLAA
ncbi:hypothetical protein [Streptomyces sp. NBC_00094]|uniref:hypothetical protein n=1 Tax=Streptomyces sp. NBC_00094 TaxID=2903620 RepID=UPI00225038E0|nr:hypothetical protein [Streptomyces sp. NBC_00094]MCX5391963.1 hypothetical protein [Streptomyces sp. NBC_00094]